MCFRYLKKSLHEHFEKESVVCSSISSFVPFSWLMHQKMFSNFWQLWSTWWNSSVRFYSRAPASLLLCVWRYQFIKFWSWGSNHWPLALTTPPRDSLPSWLDSCKTFSNCEQLKPIFFKKPCFLFFVIVFSYIAHCLNLDATQLLNWADDKQISWSYCTLVA